MERSVKVMSEQFGSDQFVVVRISGLVHTTDRLALRAIARQLKFGGFDEDNEADTAGDWVRLFSSEVGLACLTLLIIGIKCIYHVYSFSDARTWIFFSILNRG